MKKMKTARSDMVMGKLQESEESLKNNTFKQASKLDNLTSLISILIVESYKYFFSTVFLMIWKRDRDRRVTVALPSRYRRVTVA
jgi:hypothetical protein